ncbi:hypothetical protein BZG36_01826, partial [Bifiguratus adelaidae]
MNPHRSNGYDSFATLDFGDENHRTTIVPRSLNPAWDQEFDLQINAGDVRNARLSVSIWHKEKFNNKFLGETLVRIDDLLMEFMDLVQREPTVGYGPLASWHNLTWRSRRRRRKPFRVRKQHSSDSTGSTSSLGQVELKFSLLADNSEVQDHENLSAYWRNVLVPLLEMDATADLGSLTIKNSPTLGSSPTGSDIVTVAPLANEKFVTDGKRKRRLRIPRPRFGKRTSSYANFHGPDVLGVVFMEITRATDLPPELNGENWLAEETRTHQLPFLVTRTGFDVDPFVVVSFGRSTFRTRVIRHNLNPVWNDKLFFHVRKSEVNWSVKFGVYDHDKISSHDPIAFGEAKIANIVEQGNKDTNEVETMSLLESVILEEETGVDSELDLHQVDLKLHNHSKWGDKHHPVLYYRAKFVPYAIIRKQFWAALTRMYDVDGNGMLNYLEVQTMLESIGSTISEETVASFWTMFDKDPMVDELEIEELVGCLEEMLADGHIGSMPSFQSSSSGANDQNSLSVTPSGSPLSTPAATPLRSSTPVVESDSESDTESDTSSADDDDEVLLDADGIQQYDEMTNTTLKSDRHEEKVIRIDSCPICQKPNLNRRAQMDIVTHVATCAANDWTKVDRFLMGNFITEARAQRKWFVKLVSRVGYGKYQLGRNNANIIVQDRRGGQLIEEKMGVYIRLGMRLVYKGKKTGVQGKTARRLLMNMTIKQGKKFDSPRSAREIKPFIEFHRIDMSEVLEPTSSFQTFNEFFYRKLKPGSRPCASPDDPRVAVSPADCRMIAFNTVEDATRLWIKGINFTLSRLLQDEDLAQEYLGGSLAIFRLAPQDYHRFHSPVDGTVAAERYIPGQYYTVNPMAIRTTLDVYGENVRSILTIDSDEFGKVAIVCIGAMMVGSIVITASAGQHLRRCDELGYFKFGGSTLVVLWQRGRLTFDDDLLKNAEETLETLVRVGERCRGTELFGQPTTLHRLAYLQSHPAGLFRRDHRNGVARTLQPIGRLEPKTLEFTQHNRRIKLTGTSKESYREGDLVETIRVIDETPDFCTDTHRTGGGQ